MKERRIINAVAWGARKDLPPEKQLDYLRECPDGKFVCVNRDGTVEKCMAQGYAVESRVKSGTWLEYFVDVPG